MVRIYFISAEFLIGTDMQFYTDTNLLKVKPINLNGAEFIISENKMHGLNSLQVKKIVVVEADIKNGSGIKMPAFFYDLLSPYLDLDDLYQAYGTLLRGKAIIDKSIMLEGNEGLFTDAVLTVIHAYKRGVVRNLFAVLFTAAQDTTAQINRKQNYNAPNWLEW